MMRLRNKKTGEIVEANSCNYAAGIAIYYEEYDGQVGTRRFFETLAELNEKWEDAEDINVTSMPLTKDEEDERMTCEEVFIVKMAPDEFYHILKRYRAGRDGLKEEVEDFERIVEKYQSMKRKDHRDRYILERATYERERAQRELEKVEGVIKALQCLRIERGSK